MGHALGGGNTAPPGVRQATDETKNLQNPKRKAFSFPCFPLKGTQFTCFTGRKVQILTPEELRAKEADMRIDSEDAGGVGVAEQQVRPHTLVRIVH